ncbi:MAG: dihydrolipoyl dehydrogenase [Euryarchaeota archaeon]|nr:dihydrolipoyl dehydrogenase [Euryarchaeota archaeon]MDE1836231.1 dihydrolipoyl dehydrogenase [Euryarchaeota archaeon]MDE1880884.1 dihydrolipoyl dehydrogenase [Euryarchaeota archaeon]MDE2045008.1 dihydrolipoyl dehydrogenase [Thermoplasmata archaeon]
MTREVDVLILGGGPGGYVAALRLGQLGRKPFLVEKEELGGECLNRGCIPSKALIHTSELYDEVRRSGAEMGLAAPAPTLDLPATQRWRESILEKERKGIETLLRAAGASWVRATGRLTGPNSALLEGKELPGGREEVTFQACILATGAYHLSLPGFEPDGKRVLTAKDLLLLQAVPSRLVVLGGGVSGVELGEHYARLGSQVVVVEMMPQLVPGLDADLSQELRRSLERRGVVVHTESRAESLERKENGIVLHAKTPQGPASLEGDLLFLTVGKRPETRGLGLETAGVKLAERGGFVAVDDRMATNVPGIYAVGDLARPPMVAHKAYREGRVAAEVIAGSPSSWSHQAVPSVVYTDPELATVGLTLPQAREQGLTAREVKFPYAALGRAHASHATQGFVKLLAEEGSGLVLGAHAAGHVSGEFVSEVAFAIEMGATVRDLAGTIHPHPTFAELLQEVAMLWLGEPMHVALPPSAHGRR